jgi:hypothetical protein
LVFSWNQFTLEEFAGQNVAACSRLLFRNFGKHFAADANANGGLEPIAAIGEPPTRVANGDCRGERPPERKRHIRDKSKYCEADPKYLPLHISILDASALVMSRRRAKMFQIQMPAHAATAIMPKRSQHDP